jgi:hypothetical protein
MEFFLQQRLSRLSHSSDVPFEAAVANKVLVGSHDGGRAAFVERLRKYRAFLVRTGSLLATDFYYFID